MLLTRLLLLLRLLPRTPRMLLLKQRFCSYCCTFRCRKNVPTPGHWVTWAWWPALLLHVLNIDVCVCAGATTQRLSCRLAGTQHYFGCSTFSALLQHFHAPLPLGEK
jgi:uracil-DNA glycosylase